GGANDSSFRCCSCPAGPAPPASLSRRMRRAHLRHRARLDLPHPFAGDREPPADLLERHLAVEAEAVAEAKDFAFAIRQWSHRALDLVGQFAADRDLLWRTTG